MPNTLTLIASSTVGSGGATTIDFTSIPQTYTDLKLVMSTRNQASNGGRDYASIRFNGDSGTNYSRVWAYGLDGSPGAGSGTSEPTLRVIVQNDSQSTASTFSNTEVYIPNYTGSSTKSVSIDSVAENNSNSTYVVEMSASLWNSSSAITYMTIYPANTSGTGDFFVQHSTFYLYGIKKD